MRVAAARWHGPELCYGYQQMSRPSTAAEAIIALGGNLGDVQRSFTGAREMLIGQSGFALLASSCLYRSAPMGPQDQPEYLNAAILVTTNLSALLLLRRMQDIEQYFGRRRDVRRWSERTLDLDLIAYDDTQMQTGELTLPHPGMQERLFVLQPLIDIHPDWRHPATGIRAAEMLRRLIQAGISPLSKGDAW